MTELLVVHAIRAEQSGEEGVVQRCTGRLGGGAQIREADVERQEPPGKAPAAEQWGALGIRIGGDSRQRRAEADCGRDRLQGMGERVQQAAGAAQQGGDRTRVSPHLCHQKIGRCRPLGERDRWLRLLQGRLTAPGMKLREELESAHAVGRRMMHLQEMGRAAVGQPLDQNRLPGRACTVERGHRHLLCGRQQLAEAAGLGKPDASQVIVEIEVGIIDPAGIAEAERRHDDLLAKARHHARRPLARCDEALPVGSAVQHLERADRRAQTRVGLGAPHERLEGAHLSRLAPMERRVPPAARLACALLDRHPCTS